MKLVRYKNGSKTRNTFYDCIEDYNLVYSISRNIFLLPKYCCIVGEKTLERRPCKSERAFRRHLRKMSMFVRSGNSFTLCCHKEVSVDFKKRNYMFGTVK